MIHTITLKELRPQLPDVINKMDKRFERFIVTKRGHPSAILLNVDDYEGLIETLEILQDKAGVKRLKSAKQQILKKQTRSLEEIRASL